MGANLDFQRFSLNKRAAATGDLNGLVCHLWTNSFSPTPFNETSDFTEANFDGYAAATLSAWNSAVNRGTMDWAEIQSLPANFIAASASVTQSILGIYLTSPAGASPLGVHLMGWYTFGTPVSIAHAGDGVSCTIAIGYDGTVQVYLNATGP